MNRSLKPLVLRQGESFARGQLAKQRHFWLSSLGVERGVRAAGIWWAQATDAAGPPTPHRAARPPRPTIQPETAVAPRLETALSSTFWASLLLCYFLTVSTHLGEKT